MKIRQLLALLASAILLSPSVYSCEFHSGYGGGAFGMQWRSYDPDAETYETSDYSDDSSSDDSSSETATKSRPVFSNSATRAADSAKASIAEDEQETDLEQDSEATN